MIIVEKKAAIYMIISFALLAVIVILIRGCNKSSEPSIEEIEKKEFETKIKNLQDEIFKDSIILIYSDREYRDSLRRILNPE